MNELMETLLKIQEKDLKILEIKEIQQKEPDRINGLQSQYDGKLEEVKQSKAYKKEVIVKKETLETEVESAQEKINKCQLQLYQLKTNEDYRAMEREIKNLKSKKQHLISNF